MIGVMCTCAPSFSQVLHEHLPPFEILKSRLQSPFRSSVRDYSKDIGSSFSGSKRSNAPQQAQEYGDIRRGKRTAVNAYEMQDAGLQSVQTFVGAGGGSYATEDGIHLVKELRQERHAGAGTERWKTASATQVTDIV